MSIVHKAGKENVVADALSRSPCGESPVEGTGQEEVQLTRHCLSCWKATSQGLVHRKSTSFRVNWCNGWAILAN